MEHLIKKAIRSYLPRVENPIPVNAATLALIRQWEEEEAKLSPDEREKVSQMYGEIEKNGIPRTRL